MTQTLKILIILFFFSVLPPARVNAQETTPGEELASGAVVCAPGVYLAPPGDCLPLGPSPYIREMAQLGLTFPERALPALKPDPALTQLPYFYFKLDEDIVPILSAPGGGESGQAFQPGFVYVSYIDREESNGVFYMLQNGGWIPGKGSRIGEYSRFQGLQFRKTPANAFAWPLPFYIDSIPVYRAPSFSAPLTDRVIYPYAEVVQVYATESAEGVEWNMIGPDQWVEARIFATVNPNPTPPDGVTTGRWIDVDLAEQTLAVYDNNQLVFATVIASGLEPFWTRPGLFQIFQKKETETMRNNDPSDYYYLDNVPWTMYFDGARALHGAYWRTRFGYPQSHGCVNLSVGDAHWLFNWAHEGDYVWVHDPTGLTPTDPALYPSWAY
ncbi:MAG TPA: L,D-transpeptidase [Anaerolineales bacterium]|nr:L,D-transpeptidase [Anaerolineales bacterium]